MAGSDFENAEAINVNGRYRARLGVQTLESIEDRALRDLIMRGLKHRRRKYETVREWARSR